MFNNISNIYNLNIIILSIEDGKLIIKKITVPGINIIDTKTILKSIEYFLKYPTIILLNENEEAHTRIYVPLLLPFRPDRLSNYSLFTSPSF